MILRKSEERQSKLKDCKNIEEYSQILNDTDDYGFKELLSKIEENRVGRLSEECEDQEAIVIAKGKVMEQMAEEQEFMSATEEEMSPTMVKYTGLPVEAMSQEVK